MNKAIIRKENPVWDFYRDGVTQSFINKYLLDKTQCRLEYYEGWTSQNVPMYFTFGHCFHHILENAYLQLHIPTIDEIIKWGNEFKEDWFKEKKLAFSLTDEILIDSIIKVAEIMFPIYFKIYFEDFKKNWIITEKLFKVPYKETFLTGKMDGVFETGNEELWLMDHKCLSVINESEIAEDLNLDIQVNLYLYAICKLLDRTPTGLIYNIIRRPGEDFTKSEGLEKIAKKVKENPSYYFIRIPYRLAFDELHHWENEQLNPIVDEIEKWYLEGCPPNPYLNPQTLKTKYGKCGLYNFIVNNQQAGFFQRNKPFAEL